MMETKPKLLLHVCCAPDVTVAAERLRSSHELGVYFFNPNIHPRTEYLKRLEEMERIAPKLGVQRHAAPYDPQRWLDAIRGTESEPEGGSRCEICFRERLLATAIAAKELGYDLFGTVLTVSPHKNADLINKIGAEIAEQVGVQYFPSNFKKQDGFKRSLELSREFDLYRQDYCGCEFSLRDREEQKRLQRELKEPAK